MLSSVVNSPVAIQVNISILTVFVRMRIWAANYSELVEKIDNLQSQQGEHNQHIARIYQMIEELVKPQFKVRKPFIF